MKRFKDLKLRSKLPARVKSMANEADATAGLSERFTCELVGDDILRMIWWTQGEHDCLKIHNVYEFQVEAAIAKEVFLKNSPFSAT